MAVETWAHARAGTGELQGHLYEGPERCARLRLAERCGFFADVLVTIEELEDFCALLCALRDTHHKRHGNSTTAEETREVLR